MSDYRYYSESRRERIPIGEMQTRHIIHAVAKLERAIADSSIREPDLEEQLGDLKSELAERVAKESKG